MTPETYARDNRDQFLEELKEFLRIPSISTLSKHEPDVQTAARWLVDHLRDLGMKSVEIIPTKGHPVVYGEWLEAGDDAPTALIYGHYDVQPVDPLDEWRTPPFEPSIRENNLYARGASDDKGQLFVHLKAVEAYMRTEDRLPFNIKFMFEGEEECGSPTLPPFIDEHGDRLQADFALISDGSILAPDQPSIVYSLRGLTYMEIRVEGPRRDLHSGVYGGAVDNPIHALARLVAALHDEDGRIAVPGIYDSVRPLTEEERAELAKVPYGTAELQAETGVPHPWGEAGYSIGERTGARPSLDVNGIWGGFTGEGAKTVIPARAHAKLSMRLVADQDPQEVYDLVLAYLKARAPDTVTLEGRLLNTASPALVPRDIPPVQAAAAAYERTWGRPPIFVREGGTLPIVSLLLKELEMPTVLLGFGLKDDHIHAPNEKFSLANFYRGIETAIAYYELVAS